MTTEARNQRAQAAIRENNSPEGRKRRLAEARQLPVLDTCPDELKPRYLGTAIKAATQRAAAMKLKCLDCCCWQREEVRDCHISDCPLHPFRPYTKAGGSGNHRPAASQASALPSGSGKAS